MARVREIEIRPHQVWVLVRNVREAEVPEDLVRTHGAGPERRLRKIVNQLRQDPETKIRVDVMQPTVCGRDCRMRRETGHGCRGEKVVGGERYFAGLLGLLLGEELPFSQLVERAEAVERES